MAKQRAKGKGKAKAKKKKPAKKIAPEPEGPTEKEIFEMKIELLRRKLEVSDGDLEWCKAALGRARDLLEAEVDSKVSCVFHLRRVLGTETERRLSVQDKFETERDLTELMERRALAKLAVADRSRQADESAFLQQKLEMEGKLSLLEDLHQECNSHRAKLKQTEEALENTISALREKSRKEDVEKVEGLLKGREEFLGMCRDVREEWKEVFRMRMPVHAKKQLEENVRLRYACDRTAKELLRVQDRSRALKALQKSTELEKEIQSSAENEARRRRDARRQQLRRLLRDYDDLLHSVMDVSEFEGVLAFLIEDAADPVWERCLDEIVRSRRSVRNEIERRAETIEEREVDRCRLLDRGRELRSVAQDQAHHRTTLERRLEENVDRNGVLISAILRAGKIFQTRCGQLGERTDDEMDFDLLHQTRLLLDLASERVR